MAFESNSEMSRMQQDAIRRVQEMQSRAQQNLRGSSSREMQRESPRAPEPEKHALPPAHEMTGGHHQENPITDIFDSLMQDKDRTLILVLILLLVEEKSDTGLIFALMYLIL